MLSVAGLTQSTSGGKPNKKRAREIPEKRSKQSPLLLTAFPIEPSPTKIGRTPPIREKKGGKTRKRRAARSSRQ